MFYTRSEQTQRTGYWCMFAILPSSCTLTPVPRPHERHWCGPYGAARLRLPPHQNPWLRALAMVGRHHRHHDLHHFDSFLVLLSRFPDKCLVLDPRRTHQGGRSYSREPSWCGEQDIQKGTVSLLEIPRSSRWSHLRRMRVRFIEALKDTKTWLFAFFAAAS